MSKKIVVPSKCAICSFGVSGNLCEHCRRYICRTCWRFQADWNPRYSYCKHRTIPPKAGADLLNRIPAKTLHQALVLALLIWAVIFIGWFVKTLAQYPG